jgi:hypothetical protein
MDRQIASFVSKPRIEVPEDVLAEIDLEERQVAGPSPAPVTDVVPEEVRSELDHEARLADEALREQLAEGQPPAVVADDDRSVRR